MNLRAQVCWLGSVLTGAIAIVAMTIGMLTFAATVRADQFLVGNCAGCLTGGNSGDPCSSANKCPGGKLCKDCNCLSPSPSGGNCI